MNKSQFHQNVSAKRNVDQSSLLHGHNLLTCVAGGRWVLRDRPRPSLLTKVSEAIDGLYGNESAVLHTSGVCVVQVARVLSAYI